MLEDIEVCKQFAVDGIVFGCLTASGEIDKALSKKLLDAWNGPATFHRAIDRSNNYQAAAKDICNLGFERILSSGGALHVMDGLENLKKIQAISEVDFEKYVMDKREEIVNFHLKNNRFYSEFVGKNEFENWEALPIMTKKELQKPLQSNHTRIRRYIPNEIMGQIATSNDSHLEFTATIQCSTNRVRSSIHTWSIRLQRNATRTTRMRSSNARSTNQENNVGRKRNRRVVHPNLPRALSVPYNLRKENEKHKNIRHGLV